MRVKKVLGIAIGAVAAILLVGFTVLPVEHGLAKKEKYKLEFKPEVGRKGRLTTTLDMDISMEMDGMDEPLLMSQFMEMAAQQEVVESTEVHTVTDMQFDYIIYNMSNPFMGEVKFDSRTKPDEEGFSQDMYDAMNPMLEGTTSSTRARNGETIKTTGKNEALDASGAQGADPGSLVKMFIFPEKEVEVGDSWTNESGLEESSQMIMTTTSTLNEVKDGKAYLGLVTVISKNDAYKDEEGALSEAKVEGVMEGEVVYELETMWMLKADITQRLEMEVDQMGSLTPMEMQSDIKLVFQ